MTWYTAILLFLFTWSGAVHAAAGDADWDDDSDCYCDLPAGGTCAGSVNAACTAPQPGDCDDTDPAVHPGVPEQPGDSVDQDCDGTEICFEDADDDGFLLSSRPTMTSTDTDCYDSGEGENTDPATDCNDVRSSCTTGCLVDSDNDGIPDCLDACEDLDGDGYGATDPIAANCLDPSGASCYVDAPCSTNDCNDDADTCTTDCSDSDIDGVPDCADGCLDADGDNFGNNNYTGLICLDADGNACAAAVSCAGGDCNDDADTCTTNCVADADGDGWTDCLDPCEDADLDGYGNDTTAGGTTGAADCLDASGTPCSIADTCTATDCNDEADSCWDDCTTDSDGDTVTDCQDACEDADGDDHGVTIASAASCLDHQGNACALDPACDALDCDDNASSCTTDCGDTDRDTFPSCLDACEDVDGDNYGVTRGDALGCTDASGASCTEDTVCINTDCDDAEAETYPGTAENEDSPLDQQCLADSDGDGFGDANVDADSAVMAGTDCDDAEAETYPGTAENEDSPLDQGCLADSDGDGFGDANVDADSAVIAGTDCDDTRANINPNETEECETGTQIDNDCDGDPNTWNGEVFLTAPEGNSAYRDADGDLIGARWLQNDNGDFVDSAGNVLDDPSDWEPSELAQICQIGPGWSTSGSDCDDGNATIYPGALEICNGIDEDCDNQIDDALDLDPEISGCVDLFRDIDGDGYGDYDVRQCLCLSGSATEAEFEGSAYVGTIGDCVDTDPEILPIDECNDGIDNEVEGDGKVDRLDPECNTCIDGLDNDGEGGTDRDDEDCRDVLADVQEDKTFEPYRWREDGSVIGQFPDGDDNECDQRILAIELDCDDDGALPELPAELENVEEGITDASDVGLEPCDPTVNLGWGKGILELTCWADQADLRLTCDMATGMWLFNYEATEDGFGGRYEGGKRVYVDERVCGTGSTDCDDHCASRCTELGETCDGIDNDCSNTPVVDGSTIDPAWTGLPTSMLPGLQPVGTVSAEEVDMDGDGFRSCGDFSAASAQPHPGSGSCASILTEEDLGVTDCNPLCGLTYPEAEERCDGFLDACDGDPEGTDADADGLSTCGPQGSNADLEDEDVFIVVALWADPAGEDAPSEDEEGGEDTAASSGGADTADVIKIADWDGLVVPLVVPRPGAGARADLPWTVAPCDTVLIDELLTLEELVGKPDTLVAAMADPDPDKWDSSVLIELCDSPVAGLDCQTVRMTMSPNSDAVACDEGEAWSSGKHPNCTEEAACAAPAEAISRTVWTPNRIKDARRSVAEWDCLRTYGVSCRDVETESDATQTWPESGLDVDEALAGTAGRWWTEMGRFEPATVDVLTGWCWGDPVEDLEDDEQIVGGDCADGSGNVSRNRAEGPDDLLGIWYARLGTDGYPVDCETCLDGIDNNCDGAIDCADPACAVCFVGQGAGCGGGEQSPCAQTGCSASWSESRRLVPQGLMLGGIALLLSLFRRREPAA